MDKSKIDISELDSDLLKYVLDYECLFGLYEYLLNEYHTDLYKEVLDLLRGKIYKMTEIKISEIMRINVFD